MNWMRPLCKCEYTRSSEKTYEEVSREYIGWYRAVLFFYIVFATAITIILGKGLYLLYQFRLLFVSDSAYVIPQDQGIFIVVTIIPSAFLSRYIVAHFYLKVLGEHRFAEYLDYCAFVDDSKDSQEEITEFSHNNPKLYRWILELEEKHPHLNTWFKGLILTPFLLLFFLLCNSYIRVTDTAFIVNRFGSITEKKYLYDDILMIVATKSSSNPRWGISRYPHSPFYTIDFIQNNSCYNFRALSSSKQQEVAEYISRISGKEIFISDPYGN